MAVIVDFNGFLLVNSCSSWFSWWPFVVFKPTIGIF